MLSLVFFFFFYKTMLVFCFSLLIPCNLYSCHATGWDTLICPKKFHFAPSLKS
ncbi:hypothetical protein HanIR_Chr10g0500161 [Helianthus annuus]|nr:hypothetical protein HanIR_Chr10g0500161 [Helianthus annuus]